MHCAARIWCQEKIYIYLFLGTCILKNCSYLHYDVNTEYYINVMTLCCQKYDTDI